MKAYRSLSFLTAVTLLAGSVPAAMAYSASSTMSDPATWVEMTAPASSTATGCMDKTGSALDLCLQNLGISQNNSWMPASDTWLSGMTDLHCNTRTGTERTTCMQQQMTNWQTSYRSFRNWADAMDAKMQQMMTDAGMTTLEIRGIVNGTATVQTTTHTGGYADTDTMRDAWKICQQFSGRTQARCMRDALTSDSTFNTRFRGWTELEGVLNGTQRSSSSSARNSR